MTWNFDGGNYIQTCHLASYRRLQKYVYSPLLYESRVTINLFLKNNSCIVFRVQWGKSAIECGIPSVDVPRRLKTAVLWVVLYWRRSGVKDSRSRSRSNSALNSFPPIYTHLHIICRNCVLSFIFNGYFIYSSQLIFILSLWIIYFIFFIFFLLLLLQIQ